MREIGLQSVYGRLSFRPTPNVVPLVLLLAQTALSMHGDPSDRADKQWQAYTGLDEKPRQAAFHRAAYSPRNTIHARRIDAPWPMKMGTIASLRRYDVAAAEAIRPDNLRRTAILRYAS